MDIQKELASEHSKAQTLKLIKFIGNDKTKFKNLVNIFLAGEYSMAQRAAWPLSYLVIENPEIIKPYLARLIYMLNQPDNHPAVSRNILKIFEEIDIPEKYHAVLIDSCFKFIIDVKTPIAARAYSLTVASKICKKYPELKRELLLILNELNKYPQNPAINVRLKRSFKELA